MNLVYQNPTDTMELVAQNHNIDLYIDINEDGKLYCEKEDGSLLYDAEVFMYFQSFLKSSYCFSDQILQINEFSKQILNKKDGLFQDILNELNGVSNINLDTQKHIDDFGIKIGGAKKDLWKIHGIQITDIIDMNEAEKIAYIKKDNIWPKPKYETLVKNGLPIRIAYFIKIIRDAIPSKPQIHWNANMDEISIAQQNYINFIQRLKNAVMNLTKEEQILSFYRDFIINNTFVKRNPYSTYITLDPSVECVLSNKLLIALQHRDFYKIDSGIQKNEFCYDKEQKKIKDYNFILYDQNMISFEKEDSSENVIMKLKQPNGTLFYYPKEEFALTENWIPGTYIILKNRKIVGNNCKTLDEAKQFAIDFEKEKEPQIQKKMQRKKKFIPPQLENIVRSGPDYRNNRSIKGEDYLDVFGFRGGEFGNWMNENDRQHSLNYGYDALLDLCKAINISPKDISLNNRLSIAFGSRGRGNATAHYEQLREVINLTKMRGAGSLAHEWAHALDDFIGKTLNYPTDKSFASENIHKTNNMKSLKELINSMRYKKASIEEINMQKEKNKIKYYQKIDVFVNTLIGNVPDDLNNEYISLLNQLKADAVESENKGLQNISDATIYELSNFKKRINGKPLDANNKRILKSMQTQLALLDRKSETPQIVKTDFYNNSIKFDSITSKTEHGYWQSEAEMFARAFACYVADRLDYRSDYLCGHAFAAISTTQDKDGNTEIIKAYPEGKEKEEIFKNFDKLILELKEKDMLHDFELSNINTEINKKIINETVAYTENSGQLTFEFDHDERDL